MMSSLHVSQLRYDAMIGTGGIGSGQFFALSGDHTLGREESRGGHFVDRRDYCKLHIISHYVQRLLGKRFMALPIGRVGADNAGAKLLAEMKAAGLDLRYVERAQGEQTLFSFCFAYPDGSGGNLTTEDSACGRVDAAFVLRARPDFARHAGRGIVLAVPEVPLEARAALLAFGTRYQFLRVASFTTQEVPDVIRRDLLRRVDFLAVNKDEAAALAGSQAEKGPARNVASAAVRRLHARYPDLLISITAGKQGSWCWDGERLTHAPPVEVQPASTAGAGDAHLAGMLVAIAAGLSMRAAQQLGALVASMSVTSPHTIHPDIAPRTLRDFAATVQSRWCRELLDLFGLEP